MRKTDRGRWVPESPPRVKPPTKTELRNRQEAARLAHSFEMYTAHVYTHVVAQDGCCFCDRDTCPYQDLHAQHPPWDVIRGVTLR